MDDNRIREAGWNRASKLLKSGCRMQLWLASDADASFAAQVDKHAAAAGVRPDRSKTGHQLAELAGVEVYTAVLCEYAEQDCPARLKKRKKENICS